MEMTYAELVKAEKFVFVVDRAAAFDSNPTLWWDFWTGLCDYIGRQVRSKPDQDRKEVAILYLVSEFEVRKTGEFFQMYLDGL